MHIVTAMGIIRDSEGQILLVRTPLRGWEPPGGIVENGEGLLTALEREILEESGIIVRLGRLQAIYTELSSPIRLTFTFEGVPVGGELRGRQQSARSAEGPSVHRTALRTLRSHAEARDPQPE